MEATETTRSGPAESETEPGPASGLIEQAIHHSLFHFLIGGGMMVSGWIAKLGPPPDPENPLTEPMQRLLGSMMASAGVLQYLGLAAFVVGVVRSSLHVMRVRREQTGEWAEPKADTSASGRRGGR